MARVLGYFTSASISAPHEGDGPPLREGVEERAVHPPGVQSGLSDCSETSARMGASSFRAGACHVRVPRGGCGESTQPSGRGRAGVIQQQVSLKLRNINCGPTLGRCRRRVPGSYRSFLEMARGDPCCSTGNPRFEEVDQPGMGRFMMPGSPLEFRCHGREAVRPALTPGQHTDEILAEVPGFAGIGIGEMCDAGMVA